MESKKQRYSSDDIRRAKILGVDEDQDIFPYEGRILFVSNLNYDCRPQDLRDYFQPRGKLLRVDIERDRYTGEPNGLAFLEFASPADCESATEFILKLFNASLYIFSTAKK